MSNEASSADEQLSAYQRAGVDIDAQDEALAGIKQAVRSTFTSSVLSDVGNFGGLFRPDLAGLTEPVLVASADGVGTKLMLARMTEDYSGVGRDLVNHCTNDILVQGAQPLFFLDYVGAGVLEPAKMSQLVGGVVSACRENGCVLLGGETAEMPGFYAPGDYEPVGFIVGIVDRSAIFDGSRVRAGDVLLGLPSAGLHTNGYSLARKVLLEDAGLALDEPFPGGDGIGVGEELLRPHLSYLPALRGLLGHVGLHAMAHITGGGLTDNLPRVLADDLHARIDVGSWQVPNVFRQIARLGQVDTDEMYRVFNMGVGMTLIVAPESVDEIVAHLAQQDQLVDVIGRVVAGEDNVESTDDDAQPPARVHYEAITDTPR